MKYNLLLSTLLTILTVSSAFSADKLSQAGSSNPGNVKGGDLKQAHGIIEEKCTKCHTKDKIDIAQSSGKDMARIQKDMEKRGAKLNSKEREVLGIYWKQAAPLKMK